MKNNLKRVAIIGRPNVGKSTLFNRLLHLRVAITDPIPGATRDVISRPCKIDDVHQFLLMDTGGYRIDAEGELERLAIERSLAEAQRADLILLMVSAEGLTADDQFIVERLRLYSNHTILLVNKSDSIEKELNAADFYQLGFQQTLFISAEHNRNLDDLLDLLKKLIPPLTDIETAEEQDEPSDLKIALLGRPNAGKSSLANQLCGEENSIVSAIAGTTRDTVQSSFVWQEQVFTILDTAGLRRRTKLKGRLEYFSTKRTEDAIAESDVCVLILDCEEGLAEQDKKIADKIVEQKKPFIFVLNKWDLATKCKLDENNNIIKDKTLEEAIDKLRFQFPVVDYIKVVALSAEKSWGLTNLLKQILLLHKQNIRAVGDFELTGAMREWVQDRPPARRTSSVIKFKSLRQTGHKPAVFTLRVRGHLDDAYVRYIQNRVREEFGFKAVPIYMEIEHV